MKRDQKRDVNGQWTRYLRAPGSVEAIGPDEIVDVDASGRRTRRVI